MSEKSRRTVADTSRDSYKHWTEVTIRYGDTDRQGHINNAVYCTYFESGRCAFLFDENGCIAGAGKNFVIVKLTLDYIEEASFPGVIEVGSKIVAIGTSSFTVEQALFKDGVCCSTAQSIIVQIDDGKKKSKPLSEELIAVLRKFS